MSKTKTLKEIEAMTDEELIEYRGYTSMSTLKALNTKRLLAYYKKRKPRSRIFGKPSRFEILIDAYFNKIHEMLNEREHVDASR